jgi:Na+-transporting NADH:ubiquinone oxidoreductase subunit B
MRFLRNLLDKFGRPFHEGGRLEPLYPLYEAGDTFLFTPGDVTKGETHVRDGIDLKRMMTMVVVALIPCIYMALWNTGQQTHLRIESLIAEHGVTAADVPGWRAAAMRSLGLPLDNPASWGANVVHGALYFLPAYIVTVIVGGLWEALFAIVRKHEINEGFLVTSMLFPLTLPATIPLWQVALGISFGVVLGKEVFGGTGRNFLNPALTARAFLYFAYPGHISGSIWAAPRAPTAPWDALSGATPLGQAAEFGVDGITNAATNPELHGLGYSWTDCFLGTIQGSMGETSTLACLIGAAILIATGIGSWRIMAAVVVGAFATAAVMNGVDSPSNPMFGLSPIWHLVVGGFAFGTVYMATDPVSASMTATGQWIYGVLIGFMTILIRVVNPAFPEGIMLAILFGNVFAPLIDWFVLRANVKRRLARDVV